jgi:hypothetical protein
MVAATHIDRTAEQAGKRPPVDRVTGHHRSVRARVSSASAPPVTGGPTASGFNAALADLCRTRDGVQQFRVARDHPAASRAGARHRSAAWRQP